MQISEKIICFTIGSAVTAIASLEALLSKPVRMMFHFTMTFRMHNALSVITHLLKVWVNFEPSADGLVAIFCHGDGVPIAYFDTLEMVVLVLRFP